MKIIHAFFMCLSMFTRIPSLYRKWDEEAKPLMLLMLPFVGLIIGGIWFLLYYLLSLTELPSLLTSSILAIYPFFITGFIHFDGYMDVIDATHSYRDLEERRRILKDSHVGSFAVVYAIILICFEIIAFNCLNDTTNYLILIFIPIVSRIMSSLSLYLFKPMETSEYNGDSNNKHKVGKIIYLLILLIICFVISIIFMKFYAFVLLMIVLSHLLITIGCNHNLKGINGDVCGCSLVVSELFGVILLIILQVYNVL